ncbi:MAG TPA: hypothetical protein VGF67_32835, partial [Ktedonobacteraceae bacterium]
MEVLHSPVRHVRPLLDLCASGRARRQDHDRQVAVQCVCFVRDPPSQGQKRQSGTPVRSPGALDARTHHLRQDMYATGART